MKTARKVPRPLGLIIISFLKIVMIILLLTGILTIVARYNIGILKLGSLKESKIDKIVFCFFSQGKEFSGVTFILSIVFSTGIIIEGIWNRRRWVWCMELLFWGLVTIFSVGTIFLINLGYSESIKSAILINLEIFLINFGYLEKIVETAKFFLGIILLTLLVTGMTFSIYLIKKEVRDYFGIFKRRLR